MNKRLLQVLVLSFSLFFSFSLFAQEHEVNNDEKPIVLFVEFEFDAKDMGLAVELLTEMQNQTYENEDGCMSYELLLTKEKPNTIFIYECYENDAAVKFHNNTLHYKDIVVKKIVPLIKTRKILTLSPINDMGIAF